MGIHRIISDIDQQKKNPPAVVGTARTVVALSPTMPHVMVLSSEGFFYVYSIDLEKGGECVLLKSYKCVSPFSRQLSIMCADSSFFIFKAY